MKTIQKITPEIREQLIALYSNQYVTNKVTRKQYIGKYILYELFSDTNLFDIEDLSIQLRALSNITYEDALTIAKVFVSHLEKITITKESGHLTITDYSDQLELRICFDGELIDYINGSCSTKCLIAYQTLYTLGYALPYKEYTIDELVESGVYEFIKIK